MGIYDREYYREESSGGILSGRSMVWNIIILTVGMFLLNALFDNQFGKYLALTGDFLNRPWEAWRLVTYGLVHGGIGHLLGNMIGLWCFGPELEARYGRSEFTWLYATLLAVSGLTWVVLQRMTGDNHAVLIGASGAVVGVIIIGVLIDPKRELLLFGVARIPSWLFGALLLLGDVMGARQHGGNVAHSVHLAGAAFGAAYFYGGWRIEGLVPTQWFRRLFQPKLKVLRPEDEDPRDLNLEVDDILEKISKKGEASLTARERKVLEEASRRYQRRRS
jgi:membrane associated rhomboid family serine protease